MSALTQTPLFPADGERRPFSAQVAPAKRRSLLAEVERELKARGRPYVAVNEAKKALFVRARLQAFHFCVFDKENDNWLLWCGEPTAAVRRNMEEWAKVFGEGYQVMYAVRRKRGIAYRTSGGAQVTLD